MVHRPVSPEEFFLGATVSGDDYRFVLSEELPGRNLLFEEPGERVGDLGFLTEAMESVSALVARRLTGGGERGRVLVVSGRVDITDIDVWLAAGQEHGVAAVDLRVRPVGAAGAPTGFECAGEVRVQGGRCAVVGARLGIGRQRRGFDEGAGRPRLLAEDLGRLRPARVGRGDVRNVTVHGPQVVRGEKLLMDVIAHPDNPVFDPCRSERADTALLLEASRQAAILAAAELRQFDTAHCLPTRWSSLMNTPLDDSLPVRCSAEPGKVRRDPMGRPVVPVNIELAQGERRVSTVTMSVLQDC
ncbi:AfsA-related hotdog domain-containing protein [Streptomyces sp. NPDC001930]|uniref:AfsA-related hotdog domain-containing protein n=1 Tax=Streptomyces sp. NPDC001930 TaxID=3364625 RepID=UPI003697FF7A